MQSFAAKNKETFKSSSSNFVKPIIPFPNILDMMSKNSKEFQPSPIDPNILVDEKVIVNQYNLDEYYINESYGSVKRFNQLVNGDELKNGEIPLPVFLSEIRPNNIIKTPEKHVKDNLTIEAGYIQH